MREIAQTPTIHVDPADLLGGSTGVDPVLEYGHLEKISFWGLGQGSLELGAVMFRHRRSTAQK